MRKDITSVQDLIIPGKEKTALDFILEHSFRSGFGALSKTDLDLILFTALVKFSDYVDVTDNDLSKFLQITQKRIQNLKERASVKYLIIERDQAIKEFVENAADAKMEDIYIDIPIHDIAVKNELEAILDENNILLRSQLNTKIFRLRIDDFLELSIGFELEGDKSKQRKDVEQNILDDIKKRAASDKTFAEKIQKSEINLEELTKSNLKKALVKTGISLSVDILASLLPGGPFVSAAVNGLLETFQKKL